MKFWDNFKKQCAVDYLNSILPEDKSNKEKLKYMVQVEGFIVDDLIDPPEQIPFEETKYIHLLSESIDYGKLKWKEGNNVEIWKLVKRWV